MTIFLLLLGMAAVGSAIYLSIMYSSIPGAVDERLGALEALPEDLGRWVTDSASDDGRRAAEKGRLRETRTLHLPGGLFSREAFIVQARIRNPETGEIESVDPERRVPRRRVKG